MKRIISLNTLKDKIIVGFSIILALVSFFIIAYYYNYTKSKLEERAVENTQSNIRYLLSNVDKQLAQCSALSDWIFINRNIDKVLVRDYRNETHNYNLDISTALKVIEDRITSSSIGGYVTSLVIRGNNGVQLTFGIETDYLDYAEMYQKDWFIQGKDEIVAVFNGIEDNLSRMRASDYFLPIARSIIFSDSRKKIGWQMLAFSPDVIGDSLKSFDLTEGDVIFLLDEKGRCVYSSQGQYLAKNMQEQGLFELIKGDAGETVGYFKDKKVLAVHEKSDYSGLRIVQLVDYRQIESQKGAAAKMAFVIIFISLTVSILCSAFLSTNITKPIRRLLAHMDRISGGDFRPDPALEGNDEMGILGKGMNKLSSNVELLMNRIKDEEKAKSELEFKVLQNQINPHFIYNVLNSIKVMAMLQKAEGISETATALGVLLKETSKGKADRITIKEELYLLDKYIDIQKVRKKGMIQVSYTVEEGLEEYRIPRFTLQPIAENAIVHGFEGKRGMGMIEVSVMSAGEDIVIEVRDNGAGIPEGRLGSILDATDSESNKYNRVGLKNINERIKLIYGQEYGISVESRYNEYTSVKVLIHKEL
ncbi:MAG: histidine kinase [Clostridiaceae bacterium]|nr:histidine kinase [Clostridiaceae bacterium]